MRQHRLDEYFAHQVPAGMRAEVVVVCEHCPFAGLVGENLFANNGVQYDLLLWLMIPVSATPHAWVGLWRARRSPASAADVRPGLSCLQAPAAGAVAMVSRLYFNETDESLGSFDI